MHVGTPCEVCTGLHHGTGVEGRGHAFQYDHYRHRDGKAAFTALVADAPEEAGPKPALILLHEIFGLNGAMRDTARLFAEEGYLVVAPELFCWQIGPGVDLGYSERCRQGDDALRPIQSRERAWRHRPDSDQHGNLNCNG